MNCAPARAGRSECHHLRGATLAFEATAGEHGGVSTTIVSACLADGSYAPDGAAIVDPALAAAVRRGDAVAVCPAREAGLCPTGEGVYLDGGSGTEVLKGRSRVRTTGGRDITDQAVLGVVKVMTVVRAGRFSHAVLRSGTALCGVGSAPDSSGGRAGDGVLTAALKCHGVVVSELRESSPASPGGCPAGA